jgi:hypothetical protein
LAVGFVEGFAKNAFRQIFPSPVGWGLPFTGSAMPKRFMTRITDVAPHAPPRAQYSIVEFLRDGAQHFRIVWFQNNVASHCRF